MLSTNPETLKAKNLLQVFLPFSLLLYSTLPVWDLRALAGVHWMAQCFTRGPVHEIISNLLSSKMPILLQCFKPYLTPRKACKSQQWKVTSKEKLLTIWSKLAFCIKFLVAFPKMIWFGKVSSFFPKLLPKPVIFWQIFWQFATLQICHWADYPQLLRIKLPILETPQPCTREN